MLFERFLAKRPHHSQFTIHHSQLNNIGALFEQKSNKSKKIKQIRYKKLKDLIIFEIFLAKRPHHSQFTIHNSQFTIK